MIRVGRNLLDPYRIKSGSSIYHNFIAYRLDRKTGTNSCKRRLFTRIPGWSALFFEGVIMRLGIIGAGRVGASFVLAFPSAVEGIL